MTAICVDDDEQALQDLLSLCRSLPFRMETVAFAQPSQALAWLEEHKADVALTEVRLREMDGFQLTERIRSKRPKTAVIYVTSDKESAVEAFEHHPSGFILKPVCAERLQAELAYALQLDTHPPALLPKVLVQTFGSFEVLVDGRSLVFRRLRARELMAYLVDRHGHRITRAEAFSMLWEGGMYTRGMQKQLDVIIRSLRDTLRQAGIGDLLEIRGGTLRIRSERLDCDLYRFIAGEEGALRAYRGEYLSAYSWASQTEAYLDRLAARA